MKLKFITKVDNSGASFTGFISFQDGSNEIIAPGAFSRSIQKGLRNSKAHKMVRRLAVKRIIKSLFES